MKRIAMFYLTPGDRAHGGASYTDHMSRSFRAKGYEVELYRVGKRTKKPIEFIPGETFTEVCLEDAVVIAKRQPSFIAVCRIDIYRDEFRELLSNGLGFVFHSTANIGSEMNYLLRLYKSPVVVIRETHAVLLTQDGISSTFIQHPYIREKQKGSLAKVRRAASVSRVDFVKHAEVIIEANEMVPPEKRVTIFGSINRMYAHHTLDNQFTNWRANYGGVFTSGAGRDILRASEMCVDMTYRLHDGEGGSQYTFLEAWDMRVPLIVHRQWVGANNGEVAHEKTALAVVNAYELADILKSDRDLTALVDAGERALDFHAPDTVVQLYEKWLGV